MTAHDLRRVGRAHAPAGRRARHLGISERRPRRRPSPGTSARHLELYFAAPCSGRVLHTLNIRLFPEQLTYIANHAEDEVIFVDRSLLKLLWPLVDDLRRPSSTSWSWTTATGEIPGPTTAVHDYEDAAGRRRAGRASTSTTRTRPPRCATRAARPATPRASSTRTARACCTRMGAMTRRLARRVCEADVDPPGRADVPRQRLGPGPRGGDGRAPTLVLPGPDLSPSGDRRSHRGRAGHPGGRRADDLDGRRCAELEGRDLLVAARASCAAARRCRRRCRRPTASRLGLPILQAWGMTETSPLASVCRIKSTCATSPRTSWPTCAPRRASPRRWWTAASSTPARGERAAVGRRGARRAAGRGPVDRRRLLQRRARRASRSPRTAGCAPATSPRSTPTATSGSSTAPRT